MNPIALIQHYNRLNGNSISLEKLKAFHQSVQSCLDSIGHGPYVPDLKGILERATKQIKRIIDEGADGAEKIELVPIDVNKHNGKVLRVASGYEEKKGVAKEKPDNLVAEEISISKIHTDTKRFQNRTDAFSEASADSVAKNYDPNKFDPIVVWEDPKAKMIFVLSGHSRYEGMKRRNSKTIPVRYFKGNEEEAIKFAKVEANRVANQENLIEDLSAYRLMRDGDESKGVKKATKSELQKIFKGKVQKLDAYSHLSSGGLFVNALSQSTTSNYPYLERNAQWIGQLRKENTVITHAGEDNIFHYFYSDKSGRNLKQSKDEFFKSAQRKINQLGKGEGVLFPECSSEGCLRTNDKETDPIKGESYKRLREINETLASIKEKLTSHNNKLRVSTEEEKKYLRATGASLEAEKEKIQRDLDIMDKSQASLFGHKKKLSGPQYDAFNIKKGKKRKGLNKLQADQLQDSIKAGATVKVNSSKAKGEKKGWTDTPLFKSELESRQASLFGQNKSAKVKPEEIKKHFAKELKKKVFGQKVSKSADLGFVSAANAPEKPANTFNLPGTVSFLGNLQRYKMAIVIAGETHSSKSQLGMQIADAFASLGDEVAWVDWEQGGLQSVDTQKSIARNVKPENKNRIYVNDQVHRSMEGLKSLTTRFKVIAIDSGSKLNEVTNAWIDTLREEYPDVVWIIMMQQNEKGGTRGGSAAEFDAPVVLKTYRPDQSTFEKNYAEVFKNRGNATGIKYLISKKKIEAVQKAKDEPKPVMKAA